MRYPLTLCCMLLSIILLAQTRPVDTPTKEQDLRKQASRRNPDAYKQLATLYLGEYRFEEAREALAEYKKFAKEPDYAAEERLAEMGAEWEMGIERIQVIDSVVVDKSSFLQAYPLTDGAGILYRTNDFINTTNSLRLNQPLQLSADSAGKTFMMTGLKNKVYYADEGKLYTRTLRQDKWSEPESLPPLGTGEWVNYPFLCADGTTFYFAAQGEQSMGGYDLFVTRYQHSTHNFLQANNLGFPFNSPANDYMLAIDETLGLGWFASDRYQPEGKVCVYTFLLRTEKEIYDADTTDQHKLRQLAKLSSIKHTWQGAEAEVQNGLKRLRDRQAQILHSAQQQSQQLTQPTLRIIINDQHIYTQRDQFHSKEAQRQYDESVSRKHLLATTQQALNNDREAYAKAPTATQATMRNGILDKEAQVRLLQNLITQLQKDYRQLEIKALLE